MKTCLPRMQRKYIFLTVIIMCIIVAQGSSQYFSMIRIGLIFSIYLHDTLTLIMKNDAEMATHIQSMRQNSFATV